MADTAYKEALRLGQKEYRACVSRGEYPYLPVLEELLPEDKFLREQDLGLVQVPAELIVGTRNPGRANAFARNFMPLAGENSEFASKWERLCQSHLAEGIRDPIKAYEYMNRFYVEEGNKRVSVLRYFGAVSVTAQVTRILPEKTDSRESVLYFEFVDFYRLSRLNFVEFSRPGCFARLQQLLGKEPEEPWTREDRSAFTAAFYAFQEAYEAAGGKRLSATVGDALLSYLEIYGYPALRGKGASALRKEIEGVWEEIALRQEEAPIDVKLDPSSEKPGLITRVLSGGEKSLLRVAFIHDGDPETSAWTGAHERGREYVQRTMGDLVETRSCFHAMEKDPQAVMEEAIAQGCDTLFTTSARLLPAALKTAIAHRNVTVFNCSLNQSHRYIRTYYPRMYEVKFIIGALAGALAGGEPVGYLCDYPIFGQIAGINAFALGAQMVSPRCRVCLEWSSVGGADAALERLTNRGIRLISSQDMVRRGDQGRSLGLSLLSGGSPVNLATPLWQWGTYYEEMLRRIRDRAVQSEYNRSGKAMNYYWGLSAGVVDLRCSEKLPPSVQRLAELLKNSIRTGILQPFQGPLYTAGGQVLGPGQFLAPEQIISMDYLVENVQGEIPPYEALSDVAKATVDQTGVEPATKDGRS